MTRGARTHVPSLAAAAFFRPMNSQQLQAQRGQRLSQVYGQSKFGQDTYNDADTNSNTNTHSVGSLPLARAPMASPHEEEMPLPPSRDTATTEKHAERYADTVEAEPHELNTGATTPSGQTSRGESVTPLQQLPPNEEPAHLDSEKPNQKPPPVRPPQKSPNSFRSSFIRQGRRNSVQIRPQKHEKLSSAASSPRFAPPDMTQEEVKQHLGRNYEYFTGNTVFCWGGRLQNARDRPINIATGLLIVVPTALFGGFS